MLTELRQALEAQRDQVAERLTAVVEAQAALDRLAGLFPGAQERLDAREPAGGPILPARVAGTVLGPSTRQQCAREGCGVRFPPDRRRRFCSPSCRTRASQARKAAGEVGIWRDRAIRDGLLNGGGDAQA
jgi:hypothetical protein